MTAGAWSAVLGNLFHGPAKPGCPVIGSYKVWITFESEDKTKRVNFSEDDSIESMRVGKDSICYKGVIFNKLHKFIVTE